MESDTVNNIPILTFGKMILLSMTRCVSSMLRIGSLLFFINMLILNQPRLKGQNGYEQ